MACVTDTNSIDLDDTGGTLTADVIVDAVDPLNLLSVSADGVLASLMSGWLPLPSTLAYSSGTGTNVGVYSTSADLRTVLSPGMKVKFVQGGVDKYGEVVAVSNVSVTLYGGDDYLAAVGAITVPKFSYFHAPLDWPRVKTTNVPSVGYDGMEVDLVADASAGILWRARYVADDASATKWHVIYGEPVRYYTSADTTVGAGDSAYHDLSPSATITVPFAGDYIAEWGMAKSPFSSDLRYTPLYLGLSYAGAGPTDAEALRDLVAGGGAAEGPIETLAKGDAVKQQLKWTAGGATAGAMKGVFVKLRPIRVGP